MLGQDVHGATLGIIGFGRIGRSIARRATAFGMRVVYTARRRAPRDVERELGAEFRDLDNVKADFVSIHGSLTPEAHHLVGREEFRKMKRTAVLVNTARGGRRRR